MLRRNVSIYSLDSSRRAGDEVTWAVKLHREGLQEREGRKSFTAKDAKDAKGIIIRTNP